MRKSGPRRTNVPSIPEIGNAPSAIDAALKALKEATEVGYGRRGDPLDRFVTMRDLKSANLGTVIVGPGGASVAPAPGSGGDGAPLVPYEPPDYGDTDFTVPPAPTGVTGRGVPPDSIMVTWDPPNYSNHSHAEVYALLENPDGSARTLGELQADLPAGYAGRAEGTIFMHRNLVNVARTDVNPLDMALNPSVRYYWVRFVSTAGVKGPFAPLLGAAVAMSIDPVLVLDAMIENVEATPIYGNLRSWIGVEPQDPILDQGGVLGYITSIASDIDGVLQSLWSVNMRHNTSTGLVYAAGFGIGMETNETTGQSLSTFLINANQFAIMGAQGGMPGAAIIGLSGFQNGPDVILTLTLFTASHGFNTTDRNEVTIAGATGSARIDATTTIPSPFAGISGRDSFVIGVGTTGFTNYITVIIPGAGSTFVPIPAWADPNQPSYNREWVERFSGAAMPPSSIPFIVDTTRNVVGIRGDLIVDGLVRAQDGVFDELTATNAFVSHMRAETVDANVIVGQRIIAGGTGSGAVSDSEYMLNSNYLIELANPTAISTEFPFRFWKPASGDVRFSLDRAGNMVVGGHMSVAGNGVIGTTGTNLASFGGAGADGNYAMWVGPQSAYGTNGAGRQEKYGDPNVPDPRDPLFWIKDNGRAGFNADLFLGNNAFALPTALVVGNPGAAYQKTGNTLRASSLVQLAVSASSMPIRALRSGAAADTVIMASGFIVAYSDGGGGADGDDKFFWLCCELINSPTAPIPALVNDVWQPTPGVLEIQNILLDDYSPESMPYTLMNVVRVPAGNYWVRLRIHRYEDRNMSIIQGWKVVAFQTTTSGGLAT